MKAEIKKTASRFRHTIGKYRVMRGKQCKSCSGCVVTCPYGVHFKAGTRMGTPRDYLCVGPDICMSKGVYCVEKCPNQALSVAVNPQIKALGDFRWTAELLMSTWYQAETGELPVVDMEYRIGNSGGGFDKLRLKYPEAPPRKISIDEIDTSIELNKRGDNAHRITISLPLYQGGMSFGSVSDSTMISRATAAMMWNTFGCTGEGGYPDFLYPFDQNMITQVATGLFGVKEETVQRVRIVEFKYAQGAKPGLGGHLLGDKLQTASPKCVKRSRAAHCFLPFLFTVSIQWKITKNTWTGLKP